MSDVGCGTALISGDISVCIIPRHESLLGMHVRSTNNPKDPMSDAEPFIVLFVGFIFSAPKVAWRHSSRHQLCLASPHSDPLKGLTLTPQSVLTRLFSIEFIRFIFLSKIT